MQAAFLPSTLIADMKVDASLICLFNHDSRYKSRCKPLPLMFILGNRYTTMQAIYSIQHSKIQGTCSMFNIKSSCETMKFTRCCSIIIVVVLHYIHHVKQTKQPTLSILLTREINHGHKSAPLIPLPLRPLPRLPLPPPILKVSCAVSACLEVYLPPLGPDSTHPLHPAPARLVGSYRAEVSTSCWPPLLSCWPHDQRD